MKLEPSQVFYGLVNTPLTDPTAPYHSISYLLGSTVRAGYSRFTCVDANLDALNFLTREDQVKILLNECSHLVESIEKLPQLTRLDELTYRYAIKSQGFSASAPEEAIKILKDNRNFYDYEKYREAVMAIQRWLDLLSTSAIPGQFERFTLQASTFANLSNVDDLANTGFIDFITGPFDPYFHDWFPRNFLSKDFHLVGLSVNYISQLPFALRMCRQLRELQPNAILCLGGTEVSDIVKYIANKGDVWRVFSHADALVIGEGETALIEILDSIRCGRSLPKGRPGIMVKNDPLVCYGGQKSVNYEDLNCLPSPKYDIWNWSQYWSPEPVILYSPTRGCYWNRCTFCDYGLNSDSPTSPSRERQPDLLVKDLLEISAIGETVYLAVDAISPAYLRKACSAILENKITIYWSAEVRLEKKLISELADSMKKAGCVALSFGYESGSQRIIDLIDKGVNVSKVPDILQTLRNHNIGVQMMGFVGFPGETENEACTTFLLLLDNSDCWALAGIGDFTLTPGSIIAKRPHDFAIETISGYTGDGIVRSMYWSGANGLIKTPGIERTEKINRLAAELMRVPDDRPFVGGIDSSHSLLYFKKYGSKLLPPRDRNFLKSRSCARKSSLYRSRFSTLDGFTAKVDVLCFGTELRQSGRSVTHRELLSWLRESGQTAANGKIAASEQSSGCCIEIFPSGEFLEVPIEGTYSDEFYQIRQILLENAGVA